MDLTMSTRTNLMIFISFIVVGSVLFPSFSQNFIISVQKTDLEYVLQEEDKQEIHRQDDMDGQGNIAFTISESNDDTHNDIGKFPTESNRLSNDEGNKFSKDKGSPITKLQEVNTSTSNKKYGELLRRNDGISRKSLLKTRNYGIQYCPDIHFQCNNNQTCCKLPNMMGYGCCPIANAVCCDDGVHCCPPGNICDVEEGRCKTRGDEDNVSENLVTNHIHSYVDKTSSVANKNNIPRDNGASNKVPEKLVFGGRVNRLTNKLVTCKDKAYTCRDNQTCCQMPDHVGYGCCPKPNAVCCADGWHCCPHNFICDVEHGVCRSKPPPSEYSNLIQYLLSKLQILLA